jgi:hypothetical protein
VGDGACVNEGLFVFEPAVLDRVDGDDTLFESAPSKVSPRLESWWPFAIVASGS